MQCIAPQRKPQQPPLTPNNVTPKSLGAIMRGFKGAVTRRINRQHHTPAHPIWQRNYYEHIVRNPDDLARIRTYIANNPAKWAVDQLAQE